MHRSLVPAAAFTALATSALTGCVAYNSCEQEKGTRLGQVAEALDVRKVVVRTREAGIGNIVADALYGISARECVQGDPARPCPDLAIQNAGGLRQETFCAERDEIGIGPIYTSDITSLMPFTNDVLLVPMRGDELKLIFERAVTDMGQPGESGAAGYFLQVSGVSFTINCDGAAQTIQTDKTKIETSGSRIENLRITSQGRDLPIVDEDTYVVAANSFIANGNDGFYGFYQLDPSGQAITQGDTGDPLVKPSTVLTSGNGQKISDVEAVTQWIQTQKTLRPELSQRIIVHDNCINVSE